MHTLRCLFAVQSFFYCCVYDLYISVVFNVCLSHGRQTLTLRMIAGVLNTCVVMAADSGREVSTSCRRSAGSCRFLSAVTGDVLHGGTESANFWPMSDLWMTSGSCDCRWNKDNNVSLSLALDKNTLPELWSDNLSLSLSPAQNDTHVCEQRRSTTTTNHTHPQGCHYSATSRLHDFI